MVYYSRNVSGMNFGFYILVSLKYSAAQVSIYMQMTQKNLFFSLIIMLVDELHRFYDSSSDEEAALYLLKTLLKSYLMLKITVKNGQIMPDHKKVKGKITDHFHWWQVPSKIQLHQFWWWSNQETAMFYVERRKVKHNQETIQIFVEISGSARTEIRIKIPANIRVIEEIIVEATIINDVIVDLKRTFHNKYFVFLIGWLYQF